MNSATMDTGSPHGTALGPDPDATPMPMPIASNSIDGPGTATATQMDSARMDTTEVGGSGSAKRTADELGDDDGYSYEGRHAKLQRC